MSQIFTISQHKVHFIDILRQKMFFAVLTTFLLIQTATAGLYESEQAPFVDIVPQMG